MSDSLLRIGGSILQPFIDSSDDSYSGADEEEEALLASDNLSSDNEAAVDESSELQLEDVDDDDRNEFLVDFLCENYVFTEEWDWVLNEERKCMLASLNTSTHARDTDDDEGVAEETEPGPSTSLLNTSRNASSSRIASPATKPDAHVRFTIEATELEQAINKGLDDDDDILEEEDESEDFVPAATGHKRQDRKINRKQRRKEIKRGVVMLFSDSSDLSDIKSLKKQYIMEFMPPRLARMLHWERRKIEFWIRWNVFMLVYSFLAVIVGAILFGVLFKYWNYANNVARFGTYIGLGLFVSGFLLFLYIMITSFMYYRILSKIIDPEKYYENKKKHAMKKYVRAFRASKRRFAAKVRQVIAFSTFAHAREKRKRRKEKRRRRREKRRAKNRAARKKQREEEKTIHEEEHEEEEK